MVTKSRYRESTAWSTFDGLQDSLVGVRNTWEAMADSSVSGSARTEIDPVDRFLLNPTNRGDFARALHQSNRTVGDAGLSDFVVNRTDWHATLASGTLQGYSGPLNDWAPNVHSFTGFRMMQPSFDAFPAIEDYVHPTISELKTQGQRLHLSSMPNRDQADLGTLLGEIASNPIRAAVIPGQAMLKAVSRQGRGERVTRELASRARQRHRAIDGLPLEEARAAADDYLAYIFGARPSVNSLDTLAESINRSRLVADKVQRQGWKRIRRRRYRPALRRIDSRTTYDNLVLAKPWGNSFGLHHATMHFFSESTQQTWYSASYRMPVTETETWLEECSAFFKSIDRITGLGLDVRVAWDLIPFSFMADWFANTGDFLESRQIIADYNIVCEYGYVMCHTRRQNTATAQGVFGYLPGSLGGSAGSVSWIGTQETKQRTRGGNFGFNTDFSNLNSFQWSALVALGLSAAPGVVPRVRT